jgi:putative NIF3 family GTP cyclohydrolase 1 type 2
VIIAYHPPIFKPISSLTAANPNSLQASLLKCAAVGMSVYSPHTACDNVWGGVNDWLLKGAVFGIDDQVMNGTVNFLGQAKIDSNGVEEGGAGRVARFTEPIGMHDLVTRIKKHLQLSQGRYTITPRNFCTLTALHVMKSKSHSRPHHHWELSQHRCPSGTWRSALVQAGRCY